MLLRLLTDTHTHWYTHSHRSGHRLQPNTKPQAVIEADWSAPLYFQSIYSVHPGLYILIMCSASFPKRRGDRVSESGTGAAAGHWNEALPVFMGPPAQPLHHYMTFKLWTKTPWMPRSPCLSWRNILSHCSQWKSSCLCHFSVSSWTSSRQTGTRKLFRED